MSKVCSYLIKLNQNVQSSRDLFWVTASLGTGDSSQRQLITIMAKKDTTLEEREEVVRFLLMHYIDGELKRGSIAAAATQFSLHRNMVHRIWSRRDDMGCRKKERVGSKPKHVLSDVKAAMERIPQRLRVHSTAAQIDIPKSTLFDLMKTDEIYRSSGRIKPRLTERNRTQRIDFILKHIRPGMIIIFNYSIFIYHTYINSVLCRAIIDVPSLLRLRACR